MNARHLPPPQDSPPKSDWQRVLGRPGCSLGRAPGHCSPGWATMPVNPAGPRPWLCPCSSRGSALSTPEVTAQEDPGDQGQRKLESRRLTHPRQRRGAEGLGGGKSWPPGFLPGQGTGRAMQGCLFLQFLLSPYPPAEESAPTTLPEPQPSLPRMGSEERRGLSSQRGRFPPGMLR